MGEAKQTDLLRAAVEEMKIGGDVKKAEVFIMLDIAESLRSTVHALRILAETIARST